MEFHFVIEEYNRMKEWYDKCNQPTPLDRFSLEAWLSDPVSFSKFETIVMGWSKTHPRPKYPRFIDIFDDMLQTARVPEWKNLPLNEVMMREITKEIAEKYHISPLNADYNKDEQFESDWR